MFIALFALLKIDPVSEPFPGGGAALHCAGLRHHLRGCSLQRKDHASEDTVHVRRSIRLPADDRRYRVGSFAVEPLRHNDRRALLSFQCGMYSGLQRGFRSPGSTPGDAAVL